jgi:hypothetical protein
MQYTNEEKVEQFLDRSLTDNEKALLSSIIEVVSRDLISGYTNRFWNSLPDDEMYSPEPEPETRLYDGNGNKELFLDDFIDLIEVKIMDSLGNTIVDLTDTEAWFAYPLNNEVKNSIRLKQYKFYYNSMVGVTAKFTSGDVPDSVVYVATTLVSKFIERQKTTTGLKRESIEGYSYEILTGVDIDEENQALLSQLDVWKKIIL